MITRRDIIITVEFQCDGCEKAGKSRRLVAPESVEHFNGDGLVRLELKTAETEMGLCAGGTSPWLRIGTKHFCNTCARVVRVVAPELCVTSAGGEA